MILFRSKNSEFKPWHLIVLVVVVLTALVYRLATARWPTAEVKIDGETIKVLVADTYQRRFRGLSNRAKLGRYQGMLFVFPDQGNHVMVMRDMRFPLDIIWVDDNTIVDMASGVLPEPGRAEAELTHYSARASSTLVLELPAGFIARSRLQIGDKITVKR